MMLHLDGVWKVKKRLALFQNIVNSFAVNSVGGILTVMEPHSKKKRTYMEP